MFHVTKEKPMKCVAAILEHAFLFFLVLLCFSLLWGGKNFGNIGMNEIMFTLNMPMEGTPNDYFHSYALTAVLPSFLVYVALRILYELSEKKSLEYDILLKIRRFKWGGGIGIKKVFSDDKTHEIFAADNMAMFDINGNGP